MGRKVFNVMMALAVGMTAVLMATSCGNDNGNDGKKPILDQQAGTFKIINQSYDDGTTGPEFIALPGDTLKVIFTPKNDYKGLAFEINCEGLNQLNDSMFVVKKNASGSTKYTDVKHVTLSKVVGTGEEGNEYKTFTVPGDTSECNG